MKKKRIVGLSFPKNSLTLGLEPSILNVMPPGENVEYSMDNPDFNDSEIEKYLCSVYIAGVDEFKKWAVKHDRHKIIVGGYHPTMFPEEFLEFADKIVIGPCDDLKATLSQKNVLFQKSYYDDSKEGNNRFVTGHILKTLKPVKGWIRVGGEILRNPEKPFNAAEIIKDKIIPGVLTFKNVPRYDLYDLKNNQQIIPDKNPNDPVSSLNTSFGCPFKCDFCCTPVMFGPCLISKPLELIKKEVKAINKRFENFDKDNKLQRFIFIRDENFTLQKDYAIKLREIAKTNAKIYLFASANTLTESIVDELAKNNVYMVCLGLEDPTKEYGKNRQLKEVIERLKKRGIYTYLSFIVDPLKIMGRDKAKEFYSLLTKRFEELKPEMVCGNFLMPFPGTPMWDLYYALISKEDFKYYNSKTPFLIKNEIVAAKIRYYMFKVQWDYYTSDLYNKKVRKFAVNDMLHLRFLELKEEFDKLFESIKHIRP